MDTGIDYLFRIRNYQVWRYCLSDIKIRLLAMSNRTAMGQMPDDFELIEVLGKAIDEIDKLRFELGRLDKYVMAEKRAAVDMLSQGRAER